MTRRRLTAVPDSRPVGLPETWPEAENRRLQWGEWEPPRRIFICPPPPEPYACASCGSHEDCYTSPGRMLPHPGEMTEWTEDVESKRQPGRFYEAKKRAPMWPVIYLMATRCPDCGWLEIYDKKTETTHVPPWDEP